MSIRKTREEIEEKARALIDYIEDNQCVIGSSTRIFKELREAVYPKLTKEEVIIDLRQTMEETQPLGKWSKRAIETAIEYLQQPNNQWIKYSPGECLPDGAFVAVEYASGLRDADNVDKFRWDVTKGSQAIVKYMIIEQ